MRSKIERKAKRIKYQNKQKKTIVDNILAEITGSPHDMWHQRVVWVNDNQKSLIVRHIVYWFYYLFG